MTNRIACCLDVLTMLSDLDVLDYGSYGLEQKVIESDHVS